MNVTIPDSAADTVFQLLRIAAVKAAKSNTPEVAKHVCSAVATLIANCGPMGGVEQMHAFDIVSRNGFTPEYMPNGVRVTADVQGEQA